MKIGKNLSDLAVELERQASAKKDFMAKTEFINMSEDGLLLNLEKTGSFPIGETCHDQISARLDIPKRYYDVMKVQAPALLARNVNHWFAAKPERRMIRTLDGKARAFLSDRYRPLDNFDLAESALPKIEELGCKIISSELTERRLYVKAVTDRITSTVKVGDVVQSGIVISNSEIGYGSVRIEPMIYRLSCLNGMISEDYSLRKYHIGRNNGEFDFEATQEFFKDDTKLADDKAFWMKVQDIIAATFNPDLFQKIVDKFKEAANMKIDQDPMKAVEVLANRNAFTETERVGVLKHLIEGGDLSAYGLANAVSRASQDIDDYDRATDFEKLSGRIIQLPRKDWNEIASRN